MCNFLNNFSEKDITYALYGLFLGDGWYRSGKLNLSHTEKQKFYVQWLESIFKSYGLQTKSQYDIVKHTTFGDVKYNQLCITVPKRFYFETLNKCFDDNNRKIISDYVLENINELGLLFWFLDDGQWHVSFKGNKAKRFGYLNTQSFTYEENQKIAQMFPDRFGIELKIHTDCSSFAKYKGVVYYRLYFNATNFRKFFDIVRPYLQYIPKEFYYKFNMQYVPNRIKDSVEFSEKYNLI